jgi:hypothetical protein
MRLTPREWAQRFYNVQRWTTMPRSGHFAAMKEPELLAQEIRAFFRRCDPRADGLPVSSATCCAHPRATEQNLARRW